MENSKHGLVPMQEKPRLSKAQGASTPDEMHWTAVKNILKYLRNTKYMFLVYGGDIKWELRVTCYTDAVDWKSAKQSIIATSSMEAEYMDASKASKEIV
ncbi:hypothetical protein Tco_1482251 [Tanacetum coccineum]